MAKCVQKKGGSSWTVASRLLIGMILHVALLAIAGDRETRAQSCPPPEANCAAGADVIYYTTVEYYDEDPLAPRGVAGRYGPALGFAPAPARTDGDGTTSVRKESSVSGSASTGSFLVNLRNLTQIRNRVDQSLFIEGNGVTVSVEIYMKVPPGTPWVVTRQASGQLTTTFPVGSGRSDAFYGAYACSYNCASTINEPVSTIRGTTTNQRPPGVSPCYSRAGTITFDTNGWIFQSLSFCFPFGCSTATYRAESEVNASMTVAVDLPCTGMITQSWLTDCIPSSFAGGVSRSFEVVATFQGLNGNGCECCEYRQYLRRARTLIGIPVPFTSIGLWESDEGQNGNGYDRDCDEWVEDNGRYITSRCSFPGYGHRASGCNGGPNDDYGPNRATSCTYRELDNPSNQQAVKKYVEFEGRIVLRPGCGSNPSGREYIIARQSWVYCCERNGLDAVACMSRSIPNIVRPGVSSASFELGDRRARVRIGNVGRAE